MYERRNHGRYSAVAYYRSKKVTIRAVAAKMGVSTGRISQMMKTYKRMQKHEAEQLKHCSAFLLALANME